MPWVKAASFRIRWASTSPPSAFSSTNIHPACGAKGAPPVYVPPKVFLHREARPDCPPDNLGPVHVRHRFHPGLRVIINFDAHDFHECNVLLVILETCFSTPAAESAHPRGAGFPIASAMERFSGSRPCSFCCKPDSRTILAGGRPRTRHLRDAAVHHTRFDAGSAPDASRRMETQLRFVAGGSGSSPTNDPGFRVTRTTSEARRSTSLNRVPNIDISWVGQSHAK